MFEYYRNVEGNSNPVMMMLKTTAVTATQPVAGDLVAITSGLAVKAAAATAIAIGVAKEGLNDDGNVLVIVDPMATFKVDYVGSTKTSLGAADMFSAFDLKDEASVNLDATTTKLVTIVGFDNANKKAIVKIAKHIL